MDREYLLFKRFTDNREVGHVYEVCGSLTQKETFIQWATLKLKLQF